MAKMMGPRFKQCRSLGLNVSGHPKAMKRANSSNSRAGRKLSNYGLQLLEKQRLRVYYGVMERQFQNYVIDAIKSKEQTGNALIRTLECRLDNLVYRLGFASSIRQARQMVVHNHILLNGKKVNIPSHQVKIGSIISLKEKSREIALFRDNFLSGIPNTYPYLEKDENNFSGTLIAYPERDQIPIEINDLLIVEFYSKLV